MGTQEAKTIRQALKAELGVTSRQVSVKANHFSMGSSVTVTVKDHTVDFEKVEEIANRSERIRRCEMTGDILGGGNTYIHVGFSREAEEALAEPFLVAVEAAVVEAGEAGENSLVEIEGTDLLLGKAGFQTVNVWGAEGGGMLRSVWCDGKEFQPLAFTVAQLIARGKGSLTPVVEPEPKPEPVSASPSGVEFFGFDPNFMD